METPPPLQLPLVKFCLYLAPGVDPSEFMIGLEKLSAEKNIDDLVLNEEGIRNIESLSQAILPYSSGILTFLNLGFSQELNYSVRLSQHLNKDPTITLGWVAAQPLLVPDYLRQLGVDEILLEGKYLID
jgi:hypothetical protein